MQAARSTLRTLNNISVLNTSPLISWRSSRYAHTRAHAPPPSIESTSRPAATASQKQQPASPAVEFFRHRSAKFLITAVNQGHYRHLTHPEVAFAGRSNVGKSSLINSVLCSQKLVKTSKKPGHTSALNFFALSSRAGPGEISIVDMPGYGFRSRNEWGDFIVEYLSKRKVLRRVFMLVEAKVGELKSTDENFLDLLEEYKVPAQLVITKADKLKSADTDQISSAVIKQATRIAPSVLLPQAIYCSSRTRMGIDVLQAEVLSVCGLLPSK
ncbi:hypothetical protein H4R20_005418 [Coemansia guatemalensis]|uniref:GTP-binding protein 8 n=1 Tax=Coemansia guatemalensis TaxID=2761395 RepID=A0A9W8LRV5_9FUNG|nr:hypothetical protein H4R20_005418 [Coemansia guatemalensis]